MPLDCWRRFGPLPVLCLEWIDSVVYAGGALLISAAVGMAECSTERKGEKVYRETAKQLGMKERGKRFFPASVRGRGCLVGQ